MTKRKRECQLEKARCLKAENKESAAALTVNGKYDILFP
jgi:hypothetical protein